MESGAKVVGLPLQARRPDETWRHQAAEEEDAEASRDNCSAVSVTFGCSTSQRAHYDAKLVLARRAKHMCWHLPCCLETQYTNEHIFVLSSSGPNGERKRLETIAMYSSLGFTSSSVIVGPNSENPSVKTVVGEMWRPRNGAHLAYFLAFLPQMLALTQGSDPCRYFVVAEDSSFPTHEVVLL